MKPIDHRNETWDSLQDRLQGLRLAAWHGWQAHGPGTTREVALRCGIDLLTFRPRTTELYQMGFLALVEPTAPQGKASAAEGVYRAQDMEAIRTAFERTRAAAYQPELQLA